MSLEGGKEFPVTNTTRHDTIGPVQHGVDIVKGFLQYAIDWRETGEISQDCQFTADQLQVLENHYFGPWAKILLERR